MDALAGSVMCLYAMVAMATIIFLAAIMVNKGRD